MREANDRGFECLLLADCCGATDPANHAAALSMVKKQGGVFGAVADADAFIAAIAGPPQLPPAVGGGGAAAAAAPRVASVAAAKPYAFDFPLARTALVMIDFQRDFVCEGGFGAALGNDVSLLRAALPAAAALLAAARAAGLAVVHTLEGHRPDLSDLHAAKAARGRLPPGLRIGDDGAMGRILVAGERGNGIVEEVAPVEARSGRGGGGCAAACRHAQRAALLLCPSPLLAHTAAGPLIFA